MIVRVQVRLGQVTNGDNGQSDCRRRRLSNVIFGVQLFRGFLVLTLGLGLLVNPTKTGASLLNFMGIFWLVSGISFTLRPKSAPKQPISLAIGFVGILAGLTVLGRNAIAPWSTNVSWLELLGAVILITGVVHVFIELTISKRTQRRQKIYHLLLGTFEVVMGAMLIASSIEPGPLIYWLATAWALVCGTLILNQALYGKSKRRLS